MELSIIVPVYNKEKYIARCIESLLKQDLENYEIIIVNDGSKDKSDEIIRGYAKKNTEKIKYFPTENQGVSMARNLGTSVSTGKYITYIDSDDYVKENIYKNLYESALRENADIIMYDCVKKYDDKEEILEANPNVKETREISKEEYIISMPCPWNKLIKREVIEKCNFSFPANMWYEDFCMIPTLVNGANKIYYLKETPIYYYQSPNSFTRDEKFNPRYLEIFKAIDILEEHLNNKYNEELEYILFDHLLVTFCLVSYKFGKYEHIGKAAELMKKKFPNWKKNKYVKKEPFKIKLYAHVFYKNEYKKLLVLQQIKRKIIKCKVE